MEELPEGLSKERAEEILEAAKERYSYVQEYWSSQRDLQREDVKFAAADPDDKAQWPQQLVKMRENDPDGPRPCMTINRVPQHINQVVNDHRMNRPSIKVRPEDSFGDPDVARIYDGVIRHIEKMSKAHVAYTLACQNQVTSGEGYWRVLSRYVNEDTFNQELVLEPILDSLRVFVDPAAQMPDGSDAEFMFVLDEMDKKKYEKQYGDDCSDWDGEELSLWHDKGAETVVIAEYFWFEEVEKTIHMLADGRIVEDSMLMEGDIPEKSRQSVVKRLSWAKLSGTKVLDYRQTPGRYHTVIRALGNRWVVDNKVKVSGLVRNFKDAQRSYNYWSSVLVERLALQSKTPVVGYAGQFEGFENKWATSNVRNYPYLEVNAVTDNAGTVLPMPQRLSTAPDVAGIVQAMMLASDDMKTVTGQYSASLGQQSNETSGKAIMARVKEGDVGSFHYVDNMNTAIMQTGKVLVDLIPHYYDTRQVLNIIGEDNKPAQAAIDPTQQEPVKVVRDELGGVIGKIYNLAVGRYDVDIQVGAGFETRRQELVTSLTEMVKGNPALWQVIGDHLIRALDVEGADKMADRLKLTLLPEIQQMENENNPMPPEIQAQLAAAQAQIQQQQAMMQEQSAAMAQDQEAATLEIHKAQMAKKDVEIARSQLMMEQHALDTARQLLDARAKEQMAQIDLETQKAIMQVEKLLDMHEEELVNTIAPKEGEEKPEPVETADMVLQSHDQIMQTVNAMLANIAAQGQRRKQVVITTPSGDQYTGEVN